MLEKFNYTKIHAAAQAPQRSEESIGFDLYAVEDVVIPCIKYLHDTSMLHGNEYNMKHSSAVVRTGLVISFEGNYGAFIWNRSGLSVKGLSVLGCIIEEGGLCRLAGVIEGTFRGEYRIVMVNLSSEDYKVKIGDRIAQIVFAPVEFPAAWEIKEDQHISSVRNTSGWGSSGK